MAPVLPFLPGFPRAARPPARRCGQGRTGLSAPTTLEEWLADARLSRLAPTFHAHDIDLDVVQSLGVSDLKELGLSIGDRKRVLAAIADLDPATSLPQVQGERR